MEKAEQSTLDLSFKVISALETADNIRDVRRNQIAVEEIARLSRASG